jgi:hypothetical protein
VDGSVEHYNNVRLNSATGYITPKDMLAGRQQEIHTKRERKLGRTLWGHWLGDTVCVAHQLPDEPLFERNVPFLARSAAAWNRVRVPEQYNWK